MRWRFLSVAALAVTAFAGGALAQGLVIEDPASRRQPPRLQRAEPKDPVELWLGPAEPKQAPKLELGEPQGPLKLYLGPPKLQLDTPEPKRDASNCVPGLCLGPAPAPKTPREICDDEAASPLDHTRPAHVEGVAPDKINTSLPKLQEIINACMQALSEEPANARYLFQLGRALVAAQAFQVARDVYTKADAMGHLLATHNLANIYLEGSRDVPVDVPRALGLFEKAADGGVAISLRALGNIHLNGQKVPRSFQTAMKYYMRAADAGDAPSIYAIGRLHETGEANSLEASGGAPSIKFPDTAKARRWYQKGAALGHPMSMFQLGWFYDNGTGGPKDLGMAAHWYEKTIAADPKHYAAMNNLGSLYANGEGVRKDRSIARYWLQKAADGGHELARSSLQRLDNPPRRRTRQYYSGGNGTGYYSPPFRNSGWGMQPGGSYGACSPYCINPYY